MLKTIILATAITGFAASVTAQEAEPVSHGETIAAPEPETEPASIGAPAITLSVADQPLPVALMTLLDEVCFPVQAGEAKLASSLPETALEGIDPALNMQLLATLLPGEQWSLKSLEHPIVVATITGRDQGCQLMSATPYGPLVTNALIAQLETGVRAFETYEQGEVGPGITQARLKTDDRIFLDIVTYSASGSRPTTLHIIVQ